MTIITRLKGGRPTSENPKRWQINGSFTEQEFSEIIAKAKKLAISPSQYISKISLSGKIIDNFSPEHRATIRSLIGMSNNLNQIAKLAHTAGLNLIVLELDELIDGIGKLIEKGR